MVAVLLQLAAKMCHGAEAPRLIAESLSKLQEVQEVRLSLPRFIKPLKITNVLGGYNFGICCPRRRGGLAVLGCPKGGGSFLISSVGEV